MKLHHWVTLAVVVALASLMPFVVWKLETVQAHQNDALRTIMCRAEAYVVADQKLSLEQKRNALAFYNTSLESIHAKRCTLP